jgi:hypothetical protein
MACEAIRIFEAMFTNGGQNRSLRRKGEHTLPDVAHCRHLEGFTKSARRATAIGHCHNSGDVDELLILA